MKSEWLWNGGLRGSILYLLGYLGCGTFTFPIKRRLVPRPGYPFLRTAPLIEWILEELPPIDSAAIESDPDGYFEAWLQSNACQHELELKEL